MSGNDGSKLEIRIPPEPNTIAQWDATAKEWSIVVDGQWVRLDYLIESLITMRALLDKRKFQLGGKVP